MKRFLFVCLVFPATTFAADPFACVDPEFADAFLGAGYQGRPTFSTELPKAFAELQIPGELELIGSEENPYLLRAVYKTSASPGTAFNAVVEELVDSGWRDVANLFASRLRGFQTAMQMQSRNLCRDTEPGLLSISSSESPGHTYLSFSMTSYGERQTCDAMEAQAKGINQYGMKRWEELPILDLPEDSQSSHSGSGGSGNEFHSDVVVNTDMSRSSLMIFLGDQIRDQGWAYDTSWSGNLSSGSVWSKKSEEGEPLIGILHAYGESDTTYHVRFSVSPTATGGFADGVRAVRQGVSLN